MNSIRMPRGKAARSRSRNFRVASLLAAVVRCLSIDFKEEHMNYLYRAVVIALVVCIGILPANDLAALAADTPAGPEQVKQQLGQLGVGANLKVQLAGGKKLKGSVVSLGEESFELKTKSGDSPRQIAYNNVNQVNLAKLKYRAKGAPDAVEARRVVLGLGVGRHIQVKTTAGQEYHGNIQIIDSDTFTMLPDRQTAPVQIAFSDVQYVEQNLSTGAKVAIIAGVAAAVLVPVVILLALRED
jgi:ribosome maturation factor RimP